MISVFIEFLLLLLQFGLVLVQTLVGLVLPTKRKNVSGKNILITGSAQGIGKEMAILLHKLGANLALVDINQVRRRRSSLVDFQNDLPAITLATEIE